MDLHQPAPGRRCRLLLVLLAALTAASALPATEELGFQGTFDEGATAVQGDELSQTVKIGEVPAPPEVIGEVPAPPEVTGEDKTPGGGKFVDIDQPLASGEDTDTTEDTGDSVITGEPAITSPESTLAVSIADEPAPSTENITVVPLSVTTSTEESGADITQSPPVIILGAEGPASSDCPPGASNITCMSPGVVADNATLCNDRGDCVCGKCRCHSAAVTGLYCDCDPAGCPRAVDGAVCGGSARGSCQCDGQCHCLDGWEGPSCDCSQKCPLASNGLVCGGEQQGVCKCGQCQCLPGWQGLACECNSGACPHTPDGVICGGPERGHCSCDSCQCRPGWTGAGCEYRTCPDGDDTSACRPADSGPDEPLCSGRGKCVCGECQCASHGYESYTGQFCQLCPTCPAECSDYAGCMRARLFNIGTHELSRFCQSLRLAYVDELQVGTDEQLCEVSLDTDNCRFQFILHQDIRNQMVWFRATKKSICPEEIPEVTSNSIDEEPQTSESRTHGSGSESHRLSLLGLAVVVLTASSRLQ